MPLFIRNELSNWSSLNQYEFFEVYKRRRKSKGIAYLLWFFLGWHYAYINKWGLLTLYILSSGGLLIWAFIDLFRIPNMIKEYNKDIATKIVMDMKIAKGLKF